MQEFRHEAMDMTEQHFSQAETQKQLQTMMEANKESMEEQGFTETKRVKLGRNDICPCGSGKKFKKCHLSSAKKAV